MWGRRQWGAVGGSGEQAAGQRQWGTDCRTDTVGDSLQDRPQWRTDCKLGEGEVNQCKQSKKLQTPMGERRP